MTDISTDWVKENIRLCDSEALSREFLRVQTESASDSEVLRQALRNTQQLLDDINSGRKFVILMRDGAQIEVTRQMFKDGPEGSEPMSRRSLVLHRATKDRIIALQKKLGVKDISSVARFALRFFFLIVKEASNGAKFFVVDPRGLKREIRFGAVAGMEADPVVTPVSHAEIHPLSVRPKELASAMSGSELPTRRLG